MKLSRWSRKRLARIIKKMFGKETSWNQRGDFCFVHLDAIPKEVRMARADEFSPTDFFDPNCPHCKPFLDEGAIMVYTEEDLVGVRLLDDGMVETVMLRKSLSAVAN